MQNKNDPIEKKKKKSNATKRDRIERRQRRVRQEEAVDVRVLCRVLWRDDLLDVEPGPLILRDATKQAMPAHADEELHSRQRNRSKPRHRHAEPC